MQSLQATIAPDASGSQKDTNVKPKRLPSQPYLQKQSTSPAGERRWLVVDVNRRSHVRRVMLVIGTTNGVIEQEVWSCDYMPGLEFDSYDSLKKAYRDLVDEHVRRGQY